MRVPQCVIDSDATDDSIIVISLPHRRGNIFNIQMLLHEILVG